MKLLVRKYYELQIIAGPAIVTANDAGDAITLLQSLAGSTFDSSQLVLTACMGFLNVTEDKLQELREKHRPSVILSIEERAKAGRVLKDQKVLQLGSIVSSMILNHERNNLKWRKGLVIRMQTLTNHIPGLALQIWKIC